MLARRQAAGIVGEGTVQEQVLLRRDDGMFGHKHHAASHPVQRNLVGADWGPSLAEISTAVAMAMQMEWDYRLLPGATTLLLTRLVRLF
jgi:hypothetical protein